VRAALIPPKGHEKTAGASDYHLVLAQIQEEGYKEFYRSNISSKDFVIVDNGAAEGDPVSLDRLVAMASSYAADEIVIPDVLKNAGRTLRALDEFIEGEYPNLLPSMSFMFVAQGTRPDEVMECIDAALSKMPLTIGIPRHLLATFGRVEARIEILQRFEKKYGTDKPVHLLGTSYLMPGEIMQIAKQFPWVRGVDSSMPYNHAMAACDLRDRMAVTRPVNYFTEEHFMNPLMLERNIRTYLEWANGTEGTWS
jgi:hypothetical protein